MKKISVLFVCMGNICRSPTAEGVFRHRAKAVGLLLETDSAGTHAYHIGEPPDPRTQAHAARRGYDLSTLRARQVQADDFERFDHVLAMDHDNLALLQKSCPPPLRHKLGLFMQFARRRAAGCEIASIVPDPYYGGAEDFEIVLDCVEDAADGLIVSFCGVMEPPICGVMEPLGPAKTGARTGSKNACFFVVLQPPFGAVFWLVFWLISGHTTCIPMTRGGGGQDGVELRWRWLAGGFAPRSGVCL